MPCGYIYVCTHIHIYKVTQTNEPFYTVYLLYRQTDTQTRFAPQRTILSIDAYIFGSDVVLRLKLL
jgi:hypothetical protein